MGLALDEPQDDDEQLQVNGILVLARPDDVSWLSDAEVDYHSGAGREGFSVQRGGSASCC